MGATVDLHLHTLASDGRLSPTQLVGLAANQGLKVIAISDHDTTEGLAEAYQAVKSLPNLQIIPAIELSTDIPGDEVHMLGYFLQYEDEPFQDILRRFRELRWERGRLMVEKLAELGMPVDWDRVQEIAGDGSVGRPHIALALVEQGYFKNTSEAFYEYLGNNGRAYVERQKMTPEQAVEMLARVGAPAVLAHPGHIANQEGLDDLVGQLKQAGLVGMEVHYGLYSPETVARLLDMAQRYDLIPCGGSDFHGLSDREAQPGTVGPPMESVERLADVASKLAAAR